MQAAASAQRTKADVRLRYTEIHAPIDGIVDVRAARVGEVVNPGQPIVTLINPDDLWVRADVEESYIDRVRIGDTMTVRLPSGAELQGKVFYRDQRLLRNRIEDTRLLQPLVGSDMGSIPKTRVGNGEQWLLFPAKLYCGQSLLDGRRESIIIDYAFTDTLPGYREKPDFLAGRNGLQVRDEIRMVRPGFYLGRAYIGRVFLLDFTLYNKAIAERDGPASRRPA